MRRDIALLHLENYFNDGQEKRRCSLGVEHTTFAYIHTFVRSYIRTQLYLPALLPQVRGKEEGRSRHTVILHWSQRSGVPFKFPFRSFIELSQHHHTGGEVPTDVVKRRGDSGGRGGSG